MSRTMRSVVAVPALLSFLTAGAVQARPLPHPAAPPGFLEGLWQWVATGGPAIPEKEGPGMDPNGIKHHRTPPPMPARGGRSHPSGQAG
jgi:hypothetical protein